MALAGTYISNTTYGLDGNVRTINGPAIGGLPGETLVYDYDTWLRPTRLTSGQGAYVNDSEYTATGKLKLHELGDLGKHVWQTFTYQHGSQRLATARTSRENIGGFARDATYNYNDAGNITAISDIARDGTETQCFNYDGLQRLTEAWTQPTTSCEATPSAAVIGGPAPYWLTYGYDTAGNRTTETRHATTTGQTDTTRTYTYATSGQGNRLNRVTQTGGEGNRTDTYEYDTTGNTTQRTIDGTTQTLDWGPSGELTQVTEGDTTTSFVYGPDGERLLRKDSGGTTLYLPNTELRLDNGSATPVGTRYYTHGGQTVAMRTPSGVTYLAGDHQGTAQIAIDANNGTVTTRRTLPFGAERGTEESTWPNDKGFVGGTKDPTGLTHLGARQYDPDTGRFISVDPLMDPADPQQMNGYTYANNSPLANSDPDGLMPAGLTPRQMDGWAQGNGYSKCRSRGGRSCGTPTYTPPSYPVRSLSRDREVGSNRITIPEHVDPKRFRTLFWKFMHDSGPSGGWEELTLAREAMAALLACQKIKECGAKDKLRYYSAYLLVVGLVYAGSGRGGKRIKGGQERLDNAKSSLRACRTSSFVPGTTVLMADGNRKDIEDLKVGDKVIATDPKTGRTEAKPVLATIASKGEKKLVQITIDASGPQPLWTTDGKPQAGAELRTVPGAKGGVIVATDEHPFWVAGDINSWIKATDLEPGMWLRTSTGTYVQITHLKTSTKSDQHVHNLTIAGHHTYYVLAGEVSALAHNSQCPTGLKHASTGLKSIFDGGSVRGKSIIGIRSKLIGDGFTQTLSDNKKGYLFRNSSGEEVRIMRRNGEWHIRMRNQHGNYLDEFGDVANPNQTHGIRVYSR
ncbi:RHS repeat-associated core domain-containing protein [Actinomadura adrarensis]|uniref:RHS repeat-associated core domain-containing protein n=1 Tax=Actinomadura adrarensis TaxID=1819600 RepID=A0ABW3CS20_9ACTN